MKKKSYIPCLVITGSLWAALTLMCWFNSPSFESESERRKLQQLPSINADTVISGTFMSDFDKYALDQFPARDSFRTLKSVFTLYGIMQKDNNGIYIKDGYAAKLEYPLNENLVKSAADKLTWLYESYVKNKTAHVYMSIIPDKGYYLADKYGYLSMDYYKLVTDMRENMPYTKYIDITDLLSITDYYKTDTHWKQESIVDIAQRLSQQMSFDFSGNFKNITAEVPFYGVYYGQSALPLQSEKIVYLTNDVIDSCTVYNIETGKTTGIYNMEKLSGRDPYEMFLSGASPILYIDNPNAKSGRELVIFRDSFGSSLAPLLAEGYSKITLVDTRYITSELAGSYIDCENADVLFLYSTLILNGSTVMK